MQETLRILRTAIQQIIENLTRGIPPHDRVKIALRHPFLENEIWLPFLRKDELTVDQPSHG
jgi:hypothetical protein